jgi:hypothetical protein
MDVISTKRYISCETDRSDHLLRVRYCAAKQTGLLAIGCKEVRAVLP